MAILTQALRDALSPTTASNLQWKRDSRDWFYSDDYSPGSLSWVCTILEFKPQVLREWLLRQELTHRETTRLVRRLRRLRMD